MTQRHLPKDCFFADGNIFENTGVYGRSAIKRVDLESGSPVQIIPLPNYYFGEGAAVFGGKIYQLTWESGTGLVYDRKTLAKVASFSYSSQGLGAYREYETSGDE